MVERSDEICGYGYTFLHSFDDSVTLQIYSPVVHDRQFHIIVLEVNITISAA